MSLTPAKAIPVSPGTGAYRFAVTGVCLLAMGFGLYMVVPALGL